MRTLRSLLPPTPAAAIAARMFSSRRWRLLPGPLLDQLLLRRLVFVFAEHPRLARRLQVFQLLAQGRRRVDVGGRLDLLVAIPPAQAAATAVKAGRGGKEQGKEQCRACVH